MSEKKHVIIGAGTAGLNAIRTLRQMGDDTPIVLISAEPPYSRMVLPYYLEQTISAAHANTATPQQLDKWKVERKFGVRAVKLDAQKRTLTLDNDEELTYGSLLIATGSSAARPPIPGADDPALHTFWTMSEARGVNNQISPQGHTVAVGAGFITFTTLNGLMARSGKVSIVEAESRILPRMVDETAAGMMADWLTARGVDLLTGVRLEGIVPEGKGHRLNFAGGKNLEADLVLMATGIRNNLGWLTDSELEIDRGILVDERMRTNLPDVYAAGDVAQGKNLITGAQEVHAIEPTAMDHGRVAAANMAGQTVAYRGSLLMNIVGVDGLDMASYGTWDDPSAEVITGHAPGRNSYRKYLFNGERMIGAIIVGTHHEVWSGNELGMVKGLIQTGQPLGEWKNYLRENPFSVKKPFLAQGTVSALLPRTVLNTPSQSPRS